MSNRTTQGEQAADPVVIGASEAEEVVLAILERLGVPLDDAVIQARWLVEAELRGHASHGLQRVRMLAARLERGVANASAVPSLRWATDSVLLVDGDRGLGPVVGLAAIDALVARAPATGIALAAVRNANHLGLLAPYVERCTEAGRIGIALTTSEALVHPWGGRQALVGTNPIAIAVPSSPGPFVLDMATGAVSKGKIISHRERGIELGDGWAIDRDGRPTRDPQAATDGAISPFGGAKGYALGLAIELLVAALTRSALGDEVRGTLDCEHASSKGDVFICIDATLFGQHDLASYVSPYLKLLRESPPQPGSSGVAIPGDRARHERARRAEAGIELPAALWRELCDLSDGAQAARA
ncbi:MAG TPA: Ldh family oxidoreductase [Gaiellales bacterium]